MTLLAVAHRAGNSMARLHSAVALGADVIEADVHSYRGRLEIRHLKTLGPLPWLWDRWELHPASAPRTGLHDLLQAADGGATFMLDLKGRRAEIGDRVARMLHAYAPGRPVLICSRYWPALRPLDRLPWVHALARRPLDVAHPKLVMHVVDFTALPALPALDAVFLALGTFWAGSSIKGWALTPSKLTEPPSVWSTPCEISTSAATNESGSST